MLEIGLLNRNIASAITNQGHTDELIVCDSGFPIPIGVEVIDISLEYNVPTVIQTLAVIKKYHSVEKIVMAEDTFNHNKTFYNKVLETIGQDIAIEKISHSDLRQRSKNVKTIIRTGDCTAWGNVLLVSGSGDRWKTEKNKKIEPDFI